MTNNSISLCMIVKDEADHIEACLESVSGLVDEIIVIDTGSEDGTPRLASSLGAFITHFKWQHDFAAARNESLKYAKGEWILILDADEVINPKDHSKIRHLAANRQVDAYRLIQKTYQESPTLAEWKSQEIDTPFSKGYKGYVPSPLVRLFRNIPGLKFRGRVHELVEYDLLDQGRSIIDSEIPIHHYGKISGESRVQRKKELYLKIGEQKIAEQPTDARSYRDLGIQCIELKLYEKAASYLEKAWAFDNSDSKTAFNLAIVYAFLDRNHQAISLYNSSIELEPDNIGAVNNLALLLQKGNYENEVIDAVYKDAMKSVTAHPVLHFNYGLFLENTGLIDSAIAEYERVLEIEPDFVQANQRLERINMELIQNNSNALKEDNIECFLEGDIFLGQEKWVEALNSFVTALEEDPNNCDIRFKCGYTLEKLGKLEEAFEQYQEIMKIEPKHPDTLFRLALAAYNRNFIDDATTLFKEYISLKPDDIDARLNLALSFEKNNCLNEALEQYKSLLDITPDHVEALSRIKAIEAGPAHQVSVQNRSNELNIAFIWGGEPFLGDILSKKPIGGTETAMIHMTSNLAKLGHMVTVYVNEGHGVFNNVRYEKFENYPAELEKTRADVLVSARNYHPFLTKINAGVRIFWTEDAHDQPFVEPLCDVNIKNGIDRIFTVSKWQTHMLAGQFQIPLENFFITRNGVCWDSFKAINSNRNHKKLIYTSTPFRGLDVLLDIFPKIRKQVPDAELDIYSSMAVYRGNIEDAEAMYGDLYIKAEQPGVNLKKSVIQTELAKALLAGGIFAYPNHFPETSCIAVMEAMAAGLPLVTSDLGALPESVSAGGILIKGDSRSETYQKRFIQEVSNLMNDPHLYKTLSDAGRDRIFEHNRWDLIAKEWIIEFERLLSKRNNVYKGN